MIYTYINKLGLRKILHAEETAGGQFDVYIINGETGEHCGTGRVTKEQLNTFLAEYGIKGEQNE